MRTSHKGSYLFGLIFFLAGSGFFYLFVVTTIVDYYQMQSWHSTSAQLLNARLHSYQSRNDDGGYTTMYKVEANYQYQANGQTYRGDRPSIDTSSSSSRDNHNQLLQKIENEQKQHGYITIWYDPTTPSNSVYSRELSWFFILLMTSFTGVFMLIGGGIIVYTFMTRKDEEPALKTDLDKPWTTRKQWASSTVFSEASGSVKLAWFLSALSILFMGTFTIALIGQHPIATIVGVLLLLVPVFVIKWAVGLQREWNRYKKVPLNLSPYPGVIGGRVGGKITIPGKPQSNASFTVTLHCYQYRTTRNGNKKSTRRSLIWTQEQTVNGKSFINGTGLNFDFEVPANQPPSSHPDNNYHQWKLSIKGNSSGVNFDREYEIPVFITADSKTIEEELKSNPLDAAEKSQIEDRLSVKDNGDIIRFETPPSKIAWVFACFGSVFVVIGVAIAIFDTTLFGTLFASVGMLFTLLGLWAWGRNCKVEVSRSGCRVDVFWFSKPVRHHQLSPEQITTIKVYKSSTTSTGNSQVKKTFGLRIKTRDNKQVDLGGEFSSEKNAHHMKQRIEQAMADIEDIDLA